MRKHFLAIVPAVFLLSSAATAQMTPWLQWTLLPDKTVDEIVGEASGENAWHVIMETGGYDKDRPAAEYETMFHETKFFLDKMKEYNLPQAELTRFPGGQTWDAVKGELWEVSPTRQKLASYTDMAATLASGSTTADVTAELVWVASGRPDDLRGKDVKGKIVVTDGFPSAVHFAACLDSGAAGVVSFYSERPYFDPLQLPWGYIRGDDRRNLKAKFAFQIPPREAEFLKRRLLSGEKIVVHAQVVTETRKYDLQDLTCVIPGSDSSAGEVILSAHLFEGYVKQGANDDISGCAAILEVARTLNTLISEGRIPQPKRTIRFLWGPEFSGTGPWVKANKQIMDRTLCNINLDMVGEWLSHNKSFMCLMRTTYGNPHYVNDVVENYYRFVGEGNRERIQNRGNLLAVPRRIVAPTGADEPFYYSIETHYGASDHEVFNDWGVQVPGVMMIAWPDQWYHTSGDHVDKSDPTQLKRVVIIAAASAYTIASADDDMAARIAAEIVGNGSRRLSHQFERAAQELNGARDTTLAAAYKKARTYLTTAVTNEKNTLQSVNQLSPGKRNIGAYIKACLGTVDRSGENHLEALESYMEITAKRLNVKPVAVELTALEKRASKIVPRQTEKVKADGYGGYRELIRNVPKETRDKFKYDPRKLADTNELQLLANGRNSVLDVKNAMDAQYERSPGLEDILNYFEVLKAAGLVELE